MTLEKLKMRINIGSRQFIVNCADYTYERALELADKVACIRRKNSLFSRYPMDEGETREKWKERIEPLLENDVVRRDGETVSEHLSRLFESKVDSHQAALEVINAIAETFGIQPVSEEEFKKANWPTVKSFLYDVLSMGDIPADEFFPRKPLGS